MNEELFEQQISKIKDVREFLDGYIEECQNNYLNNQILSALNNGLDWGIRAIFPNFIENQVINLKNNIFGQGLIGGIKESLTDIITEGKNVLGIATNNFESISQAQSVISEGGTLDKISDLLDSSINTLKKDKVIDANLAKNLKSGKNEILKSVEENIEKSFADQLKDINKLEKYMANWKEYYKNEDFSGMQKEFNKMNKVIDSLMPIEKTVNDYRTIENLQNLIKNNGKKFNLSNEEIELANKLIN